jgi:pimeloyl-ACP methyl ester carboxylesterase
MSSSISTCNDCHATLGRSVWYFWNANDNKCQGDGCQAHLCCTCNDKRPLYVGGNTLETATMKRFCKSCFESNSTLDFTKKYTTIDGSSDVTFVFVHGGSSSRAMFQAHAEELNKRFGHSAILLDLPGHASMLDTPLTLDTCSETLGNVLKECGITKESKKKIIYVGGSLGAYVGFYLLDKYKEVFHGAILIDCGQNVGPGASYKARMGLVLLSFLGNHMSNATLMSLMMKEVQKSKADYKLIETCLGAGMFFDQAVAQVECLKTVAPGDYIPDFQFPVLFMNGSEDYRDSENLWLDLCVNKKSELKVYERGDHFFTHFSCFVEDILSRFDAFAKNL